MNTDESVITITATLRGIRPILFDRYGGDNKTKLEPKDKFYVQGGVCGIPVLNLFSLLTAQNTPSVAKLFYGKQSREVALGVQAFVNIEAAESKDPDFAPIIRGNGEPYRVEDKEITYVEHVARLNKGVPNPKERPMIPTGWIVKFRFSLQKNNMVNEATLRKMVEQGGILGLGTFRPIFGRYSVEWN